MGGWVRAGAGRLQEQQGALGRQLPRLGCRRRLALPSVTTREQRCNAVQYAHASGVC